MSDKIYTPEDDSRNSCFIVYKKEEMLGENCLSTHIKNLMIYLPNKQC